MVGWNAVSTSWVTGEHEAHQRVHDDGRGAHRAPAPDVPAILLEALAGDGDEPAQPHHAPLDGKEQRQRRHHEQPQRAGAGVVRRNGEVHRLEDLRREHGDLRQAAQDLGNVEGAQPEHGADDDHAEQRRGHEGDVDAEDGGEPARPRDQRGFLEAPVHALEGAQQQEIAEAGELERLDHDEAGPRVRVERAPRAPAEEARGHVEEPGAGIGEQRPADGVEEVGRGEDQQHHRRDEPAQRHRGARGEEGEDRAQQGGQRGGGDRVDHGVLERGIGVPAAEGARDGVEGPVSRHARRGAAEDPDDEHGDGPHEEEPHQQHQRAHREPGAHQAASTTI